MHLIFPSFCHSNSCQRSGEPVAGGRPQKALHGPPGPSASLDWNCWKDQKGKATKGGAPQQREPLPEPALEGCRAGVIVTASAFAQPSVLLGDREEDRCQGEKQWKSLPPIIGESGDGEKTVYFKAYLTKQTWVNVKCCNIFLDLKPLIHFWGGEGETCSQWRIFGNNDVFCFLLIIKFIVYYMSGAYQGLNSSCEINKLNRGPSVLIKCALDDWSNCILITS